VLGLRVPEDVAVIGSDDTDLSLASNPTLTSVVLSMDLVGVDAVRILADMIAGKKPASSTVRLKSAQLTVRESTGRRRPEICDIAGALECIQNNATRWYQCRAGNATDPAGFARDISPALPGSHWQEPRRSDP
jgi:hypothetical protein